MKKERIFYYEESPYHPGQYMITVNHDKFNLHGAKGSYHIIEARVMNLTYAQYLRMCRDVYGAEIIGKNTLYPVAYFPTLNSIMPLIKELNIRANYVLTMRGKKDADSI
jgi:hypothetical protein